MRRKQADRIFVLCVKNDDCDDLEKRKVYRVIPNGKAEKDGYVRVVDESGEDYLYPSSYFVRVRLPQEAERAITVPADEESHPSRMTFSRETGPAKTGTIG